MLVHGLLQIGDVLIQFSLTLGGHLAGTHRPGIGRRAAGICQPLQEAREQFEVGRSVAVAVSGKPGVTVLDVGRIGDLRGLSIRNDIDPCFNLPANRFVNRGRHFRVECVLVIVFLALPRER